MISRTKTNKLTNKWFLWNTLPGHTRALICCVCYEGWKAAIITDDCFLREGWHKELPSIFIICFELWGQQTGLVHEQYFHYNRIIQNEAMIETCMYSIMHKKPNLFRHKRNHKKPGGSRDLPKSTNKYDRNGWLLITQSTTMCFPSAVSW